ncbi:hypothetical protein [Kitasatospora sp. NPDC057198]|uniref:hypothetical protein n=1 Tax=Kitasatospora sp. NPDC057198 TaxID=3346046 RepID=UPI0036394E04
MTSAQLVHQLLAEGMTQQEIADAVVRDSSVISQIIRPVKPKPYNNLTPTLEALLANRRGRRVDVPEAPRRLNAQGQEAAVRKPTAGGRTVHVRSGGAIKSGAKSIANRLRVAERDGLRVAWTVVYPSWVEIGKSPKRTGTGHRPDPDSNIAEVGNRGEGYEASEFIDMLNDENGDVGKMITKWLVSQNMLDTPDVTPLSIELRTWKRKPKAE